MADGRTKGRTHSLRTIQLSDKLNKSNSTANAVRLRAKSAEDVLLKFARDTAYLHTGYFPECYAVDVVNKCFLKFDLKRSTDANNCSFIATVRIYLAFLIAYHLLKEKTLINNVTAKMRKKRNRAIQLPMCEPILVIFPLQV